MNIRSTGLIVATLALFVTGCAPEFTVDNCVDDSDCFVGQQCTAQGTCIATSAEILGFSASETTVEPGEEVTLSWSTRAAASAVIESTDFTFTIDEDELDEGSTVVTVDDDMTFVLTVVGGRAETETREVEVTVEEPIIVDPEPEILSFSASEVEVMPGATVTFEWEVEHADTIIVEQDGEVATTSEEPEGSFDVQITEATTFVLTASNEVGTATSDTIDITLADVPMAPTVLNFEASETTGVLPGTTIELTWEVDSADTVVITDNDGELLNTSDNAGQTSVEMNESQTFTLTATNDLGQDTATVDVSVLVIDPPVIVSFTASETDGLEPGDEVELTWEVTGADTVLIEDSAGAEYTNTSDLTGSVTVTISQDLGTDDPDVDPGDFFRIVASNQGGDVSQEIPITVFVVPVIVSFTASQTVDVVADSDVTLSWEVQGFDSISISTPQGEVATPTTSTGSIDLSITQDMDVTLEATNAVGTATATLSFTVIFVPTINSFTASPQTDITPGDSITLAWNVTDANSIVIEDEIGAVILSSGLNSGSFGVTVNADTSFTLKATNSAGVAEQTVNVSIIDPPTISMFEADEVNTVSGQSVQLDWLVVGADSVSITDDQGSAPISGDPASGDVVVRPQVTTTYTITATNGAGESDDSLTVTVGAAPLLITEVFYDAVGSDDGLEWVELTNTGDTFVDLANYSLGTGGASYLTTTYAFSDITIAPFETLVVGGPTSNTSNGTPSFAQTDPITIQNGGVAADGLALFFEDESDLTAATLPIDAVVWGDTNSNNLIGEDGNPVADSELSPNVAAGSSLARAGLSDDFVELTQPAPNLSIHVSQLSVERGPNESTQTFEISGFGFRAELDEVKLGSADIDCIDVDLETMLCDLSSPTTEAGLVDLTITRVSAYEPDVNGAPEIVSIPVSEQRTYILPDAFFFEDREDPPANFYCSSFVDGSATVAAGSPITLTGLLFVQGFTEAANGNTVPAGWEYQVGYFARGAVPFQVFDAIWTDTTSQMDDPMNDSNEILSADVTSPTPQLAEIAFRVSRDGGTTWIYCDSETKNNPGTSVPQWEEGDFIEWQ